MILISTYRNSWALGHVPWLNPYLYKIPGVADTARLMFATAEGRAAARVKSGSTRKDLFHYIVG